MLRNRFVLFAQSLLTSTFRNYLYYLGFSSGINKKNQTWLIIDSIRRLYFSMFLLLFGLWIISELGSPLLQARDIALGGRESNHLLYSPTTDISYFEFIQYQLELFSAVSLLLCWIQKKLTASFILCLFWFYILIDDFFRIHDSLALVNINSLLASLGISNFLYSELLYWVPIGLICVLVVYYFDRRKMPHTEILRLNLQAIIILFLCGGIVDLIGTYIGKGNYLVVGSLVFLEEFGEMSGLLFAFLVNFSYLLSHLGKQPRMKAN